ncbi:MAG: potassium channel family protein [Desulfobacterales bacterium]|nr:potassium channel family protein [Desulfobacteraceae bacterium]MDH3876244.1 potassium channel family protein [Desulfobacterales bacterium]
MTMFTRFSYHFFRAIWHVRAVILALITLVVTGAVAVTLVEKMPFGATLYFAFVTGLTIGYGDIVVKTPFGRLVAILIGFVGILMTGLIVAVLVYAVRESIPGSKDTG